MPLIPFGLRETKDVEFSVAFKVDAVLICTPFLDGPITYDQRIRIVSDRNLLPSIISKTLPNTNRP